MTTESLLTSGQSDNATSSTQEAAPDSAAPNQDSAQGDANQQGTAATTEGDKPTEGAAAEGAKPEGEKSKDATPQGAPEQYEDFKAPEGVSLDADALTEFKTLAKELNLSQADAQKVVDLGPKMMAKWQERQMNALAETSAKWATDTQTDKEFGGDKLEENLSVAKRALDAFGSPELKTLLNQSGLGNHPEIIRAFYRAGKAISEDKFVGGKAPSGAAKDARSFYSNSNMNP